ncbi:MULTISPECIES: non-ribosomal peptide synthase/polyketide synthase [unclassified Lysobacter]|uniref:non-ribosomal peptide synthetase n=1 Tax=unclassified Lysobacter TaxID=2635362 RepID=UPI001BE5D5C8|nr:MULTISPECIES: non-ribosomal peptide synthase/polyketide synthase [unclassified Lysobacter]MBT2745530.1 non-ribosomal peptide synthase/polyketide synthase [Lysobacter sp. ISL-42]MBT2753469.1 non-ribosomal peptide synthase/polyketide synthase [Lysobacter sp. ISL-50]MBT2777147.1 non-ribosomal peptide synthase/polyketide synthase [Lysobacter sp. ISL-54]MBT2780227.1 non-ribosomal peptide synthase/polyketide synthase [Lysobacter sp. ISL-52]
MSAASIAQSLSAQVATLKFCAEGHFDRALSLRWDAALLRELESLERAHRSSRGSVVAAAGAAVLAKLSEHDSLLIGVSLARGEHAQRDGVAGRFVDARSLPIDATQSVGQWLADVGRLVAMDAGEAADSGEISLFFARGETFELHLQLSAADDGMVGRLSYASTLFDPAMAQRCAGYLRRAIGAMAADDAQPVDRIDLLDADERRLVLSDLNQTQAEYPQATCIHELFEAQVARAPDATAVVHGGESLSYAELDRQANRLANHLIGLGVKPDDRVGISIERGLSMVVGVFGVLKAGGAYVPLDPVYPRDRLAHMLADSAPMAVLTSAAARESLPDVVAAPLVDLVDSNAAWRSESSDAPVVGGLTSAHLAYLIYTSGSTGTPKGVMIEHRNAVNFLVWAKESFEASVLAKTLFSTSLNFDLSIYECFAPLIVGGCTEVVDDALALQEGEHDIRLINTVPSALQALLDAQAIDPKVEVVNVAGEALKRELAERLFAQTPVQRLCNLYGPTETTTYSTWVAMDRDSGFAPHIGRPLANTQVYLLDRHLQPVPMGASGELYIGGAGVARGYFNRDELTAERFLANPFIDGERMYKTGDLGRWRADGNIEYLGRNDFQVKIRGFRIELGEIESRLVEHEAVRDAVVLAREDQPGDKRLVAYVVTEDGAAMDADALRSHLSATLPDYMLPSAYLHLHSLPRTSNGKLDRKALPAPDADAYRRRDYEAPQGETETLLAQLWADVLKLDRVGRNDHFFELGGHSLLAVTSLSRLRRALSVDVSLRDLFARPVLSELAAHLQGQARSEQQPILPAPRDQELPLSYAQQRLWFLAQVDGASGSYHVPLALRLRGRLDRDALQRTLDRIVWRHEALRTTFVREHEQTVQRIAAPELGFALQHRDLRGDVESLQRHLHAEAEAPFDLERGPLIRGQLLQTADDEHVLVVTMHHTVSDGWSKGLLIRELDALYSAYARGQDDPLPPLPIQYADYAVWQRQWMRGDQLSRQSAYWRNALDGAPVLLELPTDRPRPAQPVFVGASVAVELDAALTQSLKRLSQRHGITLYMTVLSAWMAVLSRLSGQEDVVVGSVVANRTRTEIEDLIGFFVNTQALRANIAGTVGELLQQVKGRVLDAQEHQDLPFEQVVEIVNPPRSLSHAPIFQVLLAWQNTDAGELALPDLSATPIEMPYDLAKLDLGLELSEVEDRIAGRLEYATALFDRATAERYVGYLRRMLQALASDDAQPVDRIDLLDADERRLVLSDLNQTQAEYPHAACIHELFQAQVARTPDATAVVHGGESLSYAELDRQANRLANHLIGLGVKPDDRVGISIERGLSMVVGVFGVLKAGGAYVPLDPVYPRDRLAHMLADSAPMAVLTSAAARESLPDVVAAPLVDLVDSNAAWRSESAEAPAVSGLTSAHLAYLIYTSGSTGTPKGVMIEHRNAVNFLVWAKESFEASVLAKTLFSTSLNFDLSIYECFAPLIVGGCTEVVDDALSLQEGEHDIRLINTVPSALQALLDAQAIDPKVEVVNVAGEALKRELAERLFMQAPVQRLCNLYGPTETTTYSTWVAMDRDSGFAPHIGRPLANTQVYLLDRHLQPVPMGASGELYIGGAGVARGYFNRDELTAERFLPNPFIDGERMYKTGDLGRWRADGNIEYLGRNDFQVKIRGFRIELGEIESRLVEHEAVRDAVVLAREDQPGDKRLVAYVVTEDGAAMDADALRSHLSATLPDYMLPSAYLHLQSLPRTSNGKLDRKALPAPDADAYRRRDYEAPLTETETALAQIWAGVLKLDQVGRHDHFFELGGHSLLAVTLLSRVRSAMAVEVSLKDLFARPVLSELVAHLQGQARSEQQPILPAPRDQELPLSYAQQRLWFLAQVDGGSEAYHIPLALRLRGALDRAALQRALDRIVWRHEVLRTTFLRDREQTVQRIAPADIGFSLQRADLRGADAAAVRRRLDEEAERPFDMERGPLARGLLLQVGDDEHLLAITMHHIVSDGWSLAVFSDELSALYAAYLAGEDDPLPPLPIQYSDYAVWQRQWLVGDVLSKQSDYWHKTLAGAPAVLELPTDRPRPPQQSFDGAIVPVRFDAELSQAVRRLSQRHGATLYMTVLAAWTAVLSRLSGQDDIVVGTAVANRTRAEIEGLIGFFVNTQALRVTVDGSASQLLQRVKTRVLEAQDHQDLPFEQIVERVNPVRSMAHAPIFQVMLAWQNTAEGVLEFPGIEASLEASTYDVAKFDLSLDLGESEGCIVGRMEYATSLFDRETVERGVGYLRCMLAAMAADDAQAVDRIELLGADERHQVLEAWNDTAAEPPPPQCVQALFEAQVAQRPDAIALVHQGTDVSYDELNRRANRLAHSLIADGLKPDDRVAIYMERSAEMVVGILATLKAGGAYVPLDPAYPPDRLEYMLADVGPKVVLTQPALRASLPATNAQVRVLDGDDARSAHDDGNPDPAALGLRPDHLAYVIYTSGSTGLPKGVMIEHRSLTTLVHALAVGYALEPDDRLLQFAALSFDMSVEEYFGALCTGCTLVLRSDEWIADATTFWRHCEEQRISVLNLPTAFWHQLADERGGEIPRGVRQIMIGGEKVNSEMVARWFQRDGHLPRLINAYGPTEATVDATMCVLDGDPSSQLLIGKPIVHTRIYILDQHLQPAPIGVAGELYVGGAQVARGYLNRAQLTEERFIASPFVAGERLYKTGDLCRWRGDGHIEYLGRNDFQVKIRGFRIELGEIEARLAQFPGVRESAVLAREDQPGDKRLVGYVSAADPGQIDVEALRAHLAASLPAYMVPGAYVVLERMPMTGNGKLDRQALPAPDASAYRVREYEAPVGEVESVLAQLWTDVLKLERVGRHDNFFELGGHSLLAVTLLSRLRRALEVEVSLKDLFARPVLAELAGHLHGRTRSEQQPILPVPRDQALPLSYAQQRLWFFSQLDGGSEAYHIPMALRLRGALDRSALQRALDRIVARHEVLRTTFRRVDGQTVQHIGPADTGFDLRMRDLRGADAAALDRNLAEATIRAFDLEHGPLLRGELLQTADDEHVLSITMHHIASDGWSAGVFTEELSALYAAYLAGEDDPLPPLPIQYADYAVWQRHWLQGEVLAKQSDYWRQALAGAPALLELPTDRPRPTQQSFIGDVVPVEFDAELTQALRKLGQRHGATLYMTVLAAWMAVLSRLSGQDDVVVGTAVANRTRPEIEPLIGFFVNTQAQRAQIDGSAAQLLQQVKSRVLEAQDHQDLPFEQVVELVNPLRSLAHAPIFQVMLAWQNLDEESLRLPGLSVSEVNPAYGIAKFDLGLDLSEVGERIVGQLEYASALFDRSSIERHLGYLRRMLQAMVADEHQAIADIELPDAIERAELLALGDGGTHAHGHLDADAQSLYTWILAQAERTPQATAVVEPGRELNYRELVARANGVARHLRELGADADSRIAILADRSIDSLIGVLGILAAGAAYVPVDPGYPDERIAYVLNDAQVLALLLPNDAFAEYAGKAVQWRESLAGHIATVAGLPAHNRAPSLNADADATAYVIYTSGSTGTPKGVVVSHRGAMNLVRGFVAGHDFAGQRLLMIPPLVFDASVGDVFPVLSVGAALVLHPSPADLTASALEDYCREHRISAIDAPAALWRRWTDGLIDLRAGRDAPVLPDLRLLMFGGESVPLELVRRFAELTQGRVALSNHYGPTEASVCATMLATRDGSELSGAELPIGRPLPGVRTYVLDAQLRLLPRGAEGELCIGGVGVAHGYLGAPDLTAARFLDDPFAAQAGAKLYRTGDRTRWNADGSLQFLGRGDFQVKIRGFRIELGEIEACLAGCPGVGEVAVLAREDRPGDKRLVAYVRGNDEAGIEIETLRAHLSAALPEYMVPAAYVVLERMPLTTNGKLDRKALPAPQADAYLSRAYEAPVGAVEIAIAQLWSEVLKLDQVGRHDNFFELGGHSLLAVSLIERMRNAGLAIDVRALFAAPTLQALAAAVGGDYASVAVPANAIAPDCDAIVPAMLPLVRLQQADIDRIVAAVPGGAANVQDIYPLAPLQESFLFHHALGRHGDVFLSPTLYAVQHREDFDLYAEALQTVIDRHDILRTALAWEGLPEPVQVVWRRAPLVIEQVELDPADGDIAGQLRERFDPRRYRLDLRQAPAWRWFIARDERNQRWVALELMHHLTSDHTALQLIHEEVEAILRGRASGLPAPVPFRNFVAQARLGVSREEHESYFRDLLGDIDEPTAAFGLLDTQGDGSRIAEADFEVAADLSRRLRAAARAAGVGPATLCHLAWAMVLARVSGRDDVVFGTVMFGRMHGGEGADRGMGVFINTLPLRLALGEGSVRDKVRLAHARLTELLRHEHAPFNLAQRCSAVPSPLPLFNSLLNYRYQAAGEGGDAQDGFSTGLELLQWSERTNYPLTVSVNDEADGGLSFNVQVDESVDPGLICAMFDTALASLAQALEQAPGSALTQLEVLPAAERQRVLADFNDTGKAYPEQACIHQLFEAQVARTPDATAVVHGGESLSYAELDRQANRLANHLIGLGVKPDDRVGISIERGLSMVIGVFGVLKAGGAYVPLDPVYPRHRLAHMLADSAPMAVLTSATARESLPEVVSAPLIDLVDSNAEWRSESSDSPAVSGLTSAHLAYLIYTSGSTGMPKGVMIEHRNAVNFLSWAKESFDSSVLAKTLFSTSLNFDLSIYECFAPLMVGGCTEVVDDALALQEGEHDIRLINTVPSALQALLDAQAIDPKVEVVNVAGEALKHELAERLFAQTPIQRLCNLYGPTETTTYSTWVAMDRDSGFAPHIGRPLANTQVYLLDRHLQPVPMGASGELYIGGAGVARGYFNRDELTAERFLPNPFIDGERMYKTGDLGRWRADGNIEYLGRNDFQVKIRGFRIELGEIESRLVEHESVRDAVVLAREDQPGDKRLVAYVVTEDGAAMDSDALRSHLSATLPDYMLPSAYLHLQSLPRTFNGKLDRKALPAPDADAYRRRDYEAPLGETETLLAQLWADALKLDRVGRNDRFFDLGGHSLLALQVQGRMHAAGFDLALADLFEQPTLAALASRVSDRRARAQATRTGACAKTSTVDFQADDAPAELPL